MAIRVGVAAALVLSALFAVSCGGVTDPSKNTTDTLTGTLNPGQNICLEPPVNVSNGGEYTIKITALQPTPTATLLISWWQGAGCQLFLLSNYAVLNTVALSGPIVQKGAYSVSLADPGVLTVPQTFTVTVSHP
jgi:hypothetical protein